MNHNLPPSGEQRYRELEGEVTLGDDGVSAIAEFIKKVEEEIKLGILDAAAYAEFSGDEELADKLYALRQHLDSQEQPVFPIPSTFTSSEWHNFSIEPFANGEPLDDSISVEYFNSKTGQILCYGFGSELDEDTRQHCFAYIVDSLSPEKQTIRILMSDISEGDKQVNEMLAILLPKLFASTPELLPAA